MYKQLITKGNINLDNDTLNIKVDVEKARLMMNNLKDKKYMLEIKEVTNKRSLAANSMCWAMCGELAKVMKSTDKEIYKDTLKKYSSSILYPCWEEILDELLTHFDYYDVLNARYHKDGRGIVDIIVYKGTSKMNTKEMSRFLEGLIDDCKEAGIDTMSNEEKESLIKSWNVN